MEVGDHKSDSGLDEPFDPHEPTPEDEPHPLLHQQEQQQSSEDLGPSSFAAAAAASASTSTDSAPPLQKRKGGRKPIYATSEERKQRNRQAQAAFRERRTEYIKHLELTIKQNEDTISQLQQSHRAAADECLMLRYRTSFLERVLLEKGINVQAELHAQSTANLTSPLSQSAPDGGQPSSVAPSIGSGGRQNNSRRHPSSLAPKLDVKRDGQAWRTGVSAPATPSRPHGHAQYTSPTSHFMPPTSATTQYNIAGSPRFGSYDFFHTTRPPTFGFPELEHTQNMNVATFNQVRHAGEVDFSQLPSYPTSESINQSDDNFNVSDRPRPDSDSPAPYGVTQQVAARGTNRDFYFRPDMTGSNNLGPMPQHPYRDR